MRLLILLVFSLLSVSATAEVVTDIYDARVPVEKQGASELRRAAAQGLEMVLVRVSGLRQLGDSAAVLNALNQAESFLSQYQYVVEEKGRESRRYLQMSFIGAQVEQLLHQSGLPVWSSNRPRVLVWLVADDARGRRFVTRESHPDLVAGLESQARKRGLLLSFPLLDLEDSLSIDQLWSLDLPAIEQATERYHVSQILAGRLSQLSSGAWLANLAYVSDQGEQFMDVRGASAGVVTLQPIDNIADQLAARYAVVSAAGGTQNANIMIQGVQGFPDYARVVTYLENIGIIEHANLVWLSRQQLVVNLTFTGSLQKVEQFFALDKKLVTAEPEALVLPEELRKPEPLEPPDAAGEPVATAELPESGELPQTQAPPEPVPLLNISGYYRWQGSRS